jgi:WD40 repeat protein/serine/threonine protein kinase
MSTKKDVLEFEVVERPEASQETAGTTQTFSSRNLNTEASESDQVLKQMIDAWEERLTTESAADPEWIVWQFKEFLQLRPHLRRDFLEAVELIRKFDSKFGGTSIVTDSCSPDSEVRQLFASTGESNALGEVDSFTVYEILGSGGMGIVLRAVDTKLNRQVALKVLRANFVQAPSAKQRFLREARAMAAIHHDNIAPIYQVGQLGETLYLAMPLLQGETLQDRLDRKGALSIDDIFKIGCETAKGLAAAHSKCLIHRDIKPGNLWCEQIEEGSLDALDDAGSSPKRDSWRVKLLDFGLARAYLEPSGITVTGTIAGTPAYMSPEQAQGSNVDERSDLFSLGVVLYQACTGVLPFIGNNQTATILNICNKTAPRIRSLRDELPESLDDAIQKLLAKQPEDRFQSAHEFIQHLTEIEKEWNNQDSRVGDVAVAPLEKDPSCSKESRPEPTAILHANKKRYFGGTPGIIALSMLVPIIIFGAVILMKWRSPAGWVAIELESNQPAALNDVTLQVDDQKGVTLHVDRSNVWKVELQPGQRQLRITKDGFEMVSEAITVKAGETVTLRARLEPIETATSIETSTALHQGVSETGPAISSEWFEHLNASSSVVIGIGDYLYDSNQTLFGIIPAPVPIPGVRQWQIETRQPRGDIKSVAWSPDGKLVACGTSVGHVRIYDVVHQKLRCLLLAHRGQVRGLTWTPDGNWLLTGGEDAVVRLWRPDGGQGPKLTGHSQRIKAIACHPTEDRIATASDDGTIRLWNSRGSSLAVCRDHASVAALAWRPDGMEFLSGAMDGSSSVWSKDGELRSRMTGEHQGAVLAVAWSPDGQRFATGGWDQTVQIWSAKGMPIDTFNGQEGWIFALDWSRDGSLVSCGEDATLRMWDTEGQRLASQKLPTRGFATHWSPHGERVAIGCGSANLVVANNRGEIESVISGTTPPVRRVDWSVDGQIAMATDDGVIRLLNREGSVLKVLREHTQPILALNFSSDGRYLASAGWDQKARVWDLEKFTSTVIRGGDPVAWHPSEPKLVHPIGKELRVWTSESDTLFANSSDIVTSLAWAPDGSAVYLGSRSGVIQKWDATGQQLAESTGKPSVWSLSVHPSLPLLASCSSSDTTIRIWDENLLPIGQWAGHEISVTGVQWNPKGDSLASGGTDALLRIWSQEGKINNELRQDSGVISDVCFSPDGEWIASAGSEGSLTIYSTAGGSPTFVLIPIRGSNSLTFNAQGKLLDGSSQDLQEHFIVIAHRIDGTVSATAENLALLEQ